MLETLRCPSCSTHYGLRPHRVRIGIRRARCFRCGGIFGIETEVSRLLGPLPPSVPEFLEEVPADRHLEPGPDTLVAPLPEAAPEPVFAAPEPDVLVLEPEAADIVALEPEGLDAVGLEPEAMAAGDLEDLILMDANVPTAEEAPLPVNPAPSELEESLVLGDFGDEDIMEKTLVVEPMAPPPPSSSLPANDALEAPSGSYRSAKDAISRLLGDLPAPGPANTERRTLARTSSGMDVEATLDALETTLGGVPEAPAEPSLESTRPMNPASLLNAAPLSPAGPPPGVPSELEGGSTVRISQQDLLAALTRPEGMDSPAGPRPVAPPPAPLPEPMSPEVPAAAPVANDPGLLKLQVGGETYQNLNVEQITVWIEQGRVLENNLVARQFSDNWIEAAKVPTLRPIFERVRRNRNAPADLIPPPSPELPQKRSLFGGLFGRN